MTRLPGKPSTAHPSALKPLSRRVRSVHRIEYRCKSGVMWLGGAVEKFALRQIEKGCADEFACRVDHLNENSYVSRGSECGSCDRRWPPNADRSGRAHSAQRSFAGSPRKQGRIAGGGWRVYGEKQMGPYVAFGGHTCNTVEGGGISAAVRRQLATAGQACPHRTAYGSPVECAS